ncbi:MAG: hypothetical protein AAFR89_03650, partial [Cyanobacteria bacterium J06633_1]
TQTMLPAIKTKLVQIFLKTLKCVRDFSDLDRCRDKWKNHQSMTLNQIQQSIYLERLIESATKLLQSPKPLSL